MTSATATTVDATSATTGDYCGEDPPDNPAPTDTCADPVPIMQETPDGPVESGFVRCSGGVVHRVAKIDCVYAPDLFQPMCPIEDPNNECATFEDCTAGDYPYCVSQGMEGTCGCHYSCTTDADCGDGMICYCNGWANECVPASCTTDADCGGYQCAKSSGSVGGFACQTPFDECRGNEDCPGEECPECAPDAASCAWTCQPSEYGCTTAGRPFVVDGHEVRAPIVARGDWRSDVAASQASAEDRVRLAAWWRDAAAMEHASVASFARFALQLVALGAPPDLLADTSAAMRDEVEHARIMYGLASTDGGANVGPGALPCIGGMDGEMDLVAVTCSVVREACIAETLAAVELAEAARHAVAPERSALLRTIADDELRHAALGWRFLRWALGRATASERSTIDAAIRDALADARAQTSAGLAGLREHGVLDAKLANACRRDALAQIVTPLVAALLGEERRAAAVA